jgi:hypothetical protein
MKIKITESQYRRVILEQPESVMDRRVGIERTNMQALGLNPLSNTDVQKYNTQVYGRPFTGHEVATILQIGTAFIPIVGPYISSGIGFLEAKSYWDEGKKQEATLVAIFSSLPMIGSIVMKIPGVKELGQRGMAALASKIVRLGEKFKPSKIEQEVIQGIEQNINLVETEVKSTAKKFDLKRTGTKSKKIRWDYEKRKITDNLEFIGKPKGGKGMVGEVVNTLDKNQTVTLRKGSDEFGDFYFMQAEMTNPRDAGIAFNELKKLIPSGARFGEPATGSLSTDSFYSMLRRIRVKDFIPKVKNYIRLNGSGIKRFQSFIQNQIKTNEHPNILRFQNIEDAKKLVNGINDEIKKYGISSLSKVQKNSEGLFEILIPNIELIMK